MPGNDMPENDMPENDMPGSQILTRPALIILLMLVAGCSYVPFSGGKLEGTVAAPPADWSEAARAAVVELETQPADPYSVKLWVVGIGPALYVHAGANRATWVEHIETNPDVRMRIDGSVYELTALRVEDGAEFKTFSDAYESKYGNRPRNENVSEAYLYRLETRRRDARRGSSLPPLTSRTSG